MVTVADAGGQTVELLTVYVKIYGLPEMDKLERFKVPKLPLIVANGPVHTPRFEGVPAKLLNKFINPPFAKVVSQMLTLALVPAFTKSSTVTVTVAESDGQETFPGTV